MTLTHHPPKVRHLQAHPAMVPLAQPVRTASGTITHAPLVLVDLHTEVSGQAGPTGRAYLFTYTPLALKATVEMLSGLNALVAGQPCAPVALFDSLQARFRLLGHTGIVGMALAGIDMAAWDAFAKAQGLPLVRALGANPKPTPAYFSQGMDGLARGVELAAEAVERGFAGMKIKVGYPTLAEDLAVIRAVYRALSEPLHAALTDRAHSADQTARTLMVDYNQSLSYAEALARCAALDRLADEGITLGWIEEPLRRDDFAGHAALAAQVRTPLQLGENWFSLAEMAQALQAKASDLAMPDLMKIGGPTAWQRAAGLAAAARLPMSSHLFHEVTAHLMPATPTAHWLEYLPLADPLLQAPVVPDAKGFIAPGEQPGNGLTWDEAVVVRLAA